MQIGIKYHFWVFGMNWPGSEPRSRTLLANTRFTRSIGRDIYIYIYIYIYLIFIHLFSFIDCYVVNSSVFNSVSNTSGSINLDIRYKSFARKYILFQVFQYDTNNLRSIIWFQVTILISCGMVDFAVPTDHRVKLKESKRKDKNLDLTRDVKQKLLNIEVTGIPIVIVMNSWVTKGLIKRLEDLERRGRMKTI